MSSSSYKNADEIFKRFKDFEQLKLIAETKNIDTADKTKSELIEELIDLVKKSGISCILRTLKVATARALAADIDWSDQANGRAPNNRALVVSRICDRMGTNPAKFLRKKELRLLIKIVHHLDEIEVEPVDKEHCIQLILEQAERMGLEHIFSAFSTERLKDFCKTCSLQVDTMSYDTLMDSLLKLENFQSKKEPKRPKKKPDIDDKITVNELKAHYLRDELVDWLNEHNVPSDGPKDFLSKKIFNTLHNLPLPTKPPTSNRRKKSEPQNHSKSEDSVGQSEEDEEEDSEPKKKGRKEKEKQKQEKVEEEEEEEEEEEQQQEHQQQQPQEQEEEEKEKEKAEEEEKEEEEEKPVKRKKKKVEEEESSSPKKSKKRKEEDKSPKKSKKGKEESEGEEEESREEPPKKKFEADSRLDKEKKDSKGKKK